MLIETERLRMRPLNLADLETIVSLHASPEVSRFLFPLPRERAVERLVACEDEWKDRGHGLLAIHCRQTGEFLGRTGLKYWPQFDETEIGWVLHPSSWGNGYATEAASACASWGFEHLEASYLTAMIVPENIRSIWVATRIGMSPVRNDNLLGVPVTVHSITRDQWNSRVAE